MITFAALLQWQATLQRAARQQPARQQQPRAEVAAAPEGGRESTPARNLANSTR
jgi:hypothetical protein